MKCPKCELASCRILATAQHEDLNVLVPLRLRWHEALVGHAGGWRFESCFAFGSQGYMSPTGVETTGSRACESIYCTQFFALTPRMVILDHGLRAYRVAEPSTRPRSRDAPTLIGIIDALEGDGRVYGRC